MGIPFTARTPVPFTPPALSAAHAAKVRAEAEAAHREGREVKPVAEPAKIYVSVPTMFQKDNLASALTGAGIINYSKQQLRDLILAGVTHLYDEDRFDAARADLEALWQAKDAADEVAEKRAAYVADLTERESELPSDKKTSPKEIMDAIDAIRVGVVIPEQQRVRAAAIQQDITSRYEPLQKAFADLAGQSVKRDYFVIETYVVTWEGLPHKPDEKPDGGLSRRESQWLRGQIGIEAFTELASLIFAMHGLDDDDEGNLHSLIESFSDLTGSTVAESRGEKTSEPGKSEDGPTTRTRAGGSPTTRGSSSKRSRRSGTKKGSSASGRTAGRSSTSPSSS